METVIMGIYKLIENVIPDLVIAGYVLLGFGLGRFNV